MCVRVCREGDVLMRSMTDRNRILVEYNRSKDLQRWTVEKGEGKERKNEVYSFVAFISHLPPDPPFPPGEEGKKSVVGGWYILYNVIAWNDYVDRHEMLIINTSCHFILEVEW